MYNLKTRSFHTSPFKFSIILLLILLTACKPQEWLSSFGLQSAEEAKPSATPPPTQVTTLKLHPRDVDVNFEYIGQVAGSLEVEVRARITGIVEQRLFKEGKAVKAGETLFTLDPKPFAAQLAQAKAALAVANAAKASAQAQLKKAQRDFARIAPLSKKKLVSHNEKDNAESSIELAKAAIQQANATILQAQASIKSAQINVDYTKVKAPISGIAGRVLKTQGSLAEAGSNSLLTTIAQINPAYINFGIAEAELLQREQAIREGQLTLPDSGFMVKLKTSTGQHLKQTGTIDFRDYKINSSTGTFSMRASINNSSQTLAPGQFVRVILSGAKRVNTFAIPQRAVLDSPKGKYVYLAEKNDKGGFIAQKRSVSVGEWVLLSDETESTDSNNKAWIIKSGLKQGEQVVINGMARIFYPGMPIQPSLNETAMAKEKTSPKKILPNKKVAKDKSEG